MPCYTIQVNTLDLKVADLDILRKVVEDLGFTEVYVDHRYEQLSFAKGDKEFLFDRAAGTLTVPAGYERYADQIRAGYTEEAVQQAADLYGWNLEKTDNVMTLRRDS